MTDLMKMIGERIRSYRKEQNLSQEELAHLSGLHVTYIGKIERAEKVCTIEVLAKITGALGVPLEEFFHFVQPASEGRDDSTLAQIVDRLRSRSVDDQKRVLQIIDLVFKE